jgi:tRNA/rRNA methyltransferase
MSLSNIRIVLVRPRGAGNVGAVARAMKNTGLRELVLVRPALAVSNSLPLTDVPDRGVRSEPMGAVSDVEGANGPSKRMPDGTPFWAKAMAVHADDVLKGVRQVDSLAAAVADCGLVVGTTCRDGLYRAAAEPPRAVATRVLAAAAANRVAVVFGPEDHGLSNADLKACHQLIIIPTAPAYPSLNLAQAVMVCCYELFVAAHTGQPDAARTATRPAPVLATAQRVALMFRRLQAAFLSIGFLHPDNPDHIMYAFRRMLGRAQMEERDVRILLALARQIEWFGHGGWQGAALGRRSHLDPGPPDEAEEMCLPRGGEVAPKGA